MSAMDMRSGNDVVRQNPLIMGLIDSIMSLRESLCLDSDGAMRITQRTLEAVYQKIHRKTSEAVARAGANGGRTIGEYMDALSINQQQESPQANAFRSVNVCMQIRDVIIHTCPEIEFSLPCIEMPTAAAAAAAAAATVTVTELDQQDQIRSLEQEIRSVKESWHHLERRKLELVQPTQQQQQQQPSFVSSFFGNLHSKSAEQTLSPEDEVEFAELNRKSAELESVRDTLCAKRRKLQQRQTRLESQRFMQQDPMEV
jgi:hypothetical protein